MANHNHEQRSWKEDPFLHNYNATDLKVASEFLSNWLPFLSHGLCRRCTRTLSDRVRSLEVDGVTEPWRQEDNLQATACNVAVNDFAESHDNCDTNSIGSWKESGCVHDTADTNSVGSWKDSAAEVEFEASASEPLNLVPGSVKSPMVKMSWADMAQEDELEPAEESYQDDSEESAAAEDTPSKEVKPKMQLSREQREHIRFNNVKRKKDFICLERFNGKLVNILDGLELHTGVFSAAEQKRIVQFVEELQEKGRNGQLKDRTYTAPQKWMKGKGRVTIQFGCCYNYAMDRKGNPPGILKNEEVDPIPHLLKVMIKRIVRWHVLPPSCVPDSCIVNIYDEGDCIPPHIDNHDFVRPFCTVSFLSECNILFGSNLKIIGPGEFSGSIAIPLPVGSVLILNGNGADVAKHCVPAVPTKRMSITFRRMDETKRPIGYIPEPDLQGLQPLTLEADSLASNSPKSGQFMRKQSFKREGRAESTAKANGYGYINKRPDSRRFNRIKRGPIDQHRVQATFQDSGVYYRN